jgi:ankyrin repeat protein
MSSANEELCGAAYRGDVAEIERQIAAGADANAFEGTGDWTPLQMAAANGHVAAITALVKAGARVDGADNLGHTSLMFAVVEGHSAAIDALLAAGADVNRAINIGSTTLHWASNKGHLDTACVLLEAGSRAEVRNREGQRPIDVVRWPPAP